MIDLLSRNARSGDIYINIALLHFAFGESGMGQGPEWRWKMAFQGRLSEPDKASALLQDTYRRLGIIAKSPRLSSAATEFVSRDDALRLAF